MQVHAEPPIVIQHKELQRELENSLKTTSDEHGTENATETEEQEESESQQVESETKEDEGQVNIVNVDNEDTEDDEMAMKPPAKVRYVSCSRFAALPRSQKDKETDFDPNELLDLATTTLREEPLVFYRYTFKITVDKCLRNELLPQIQQTIKKIWRVMQRDDPDLHVAMWRFEEVKDELKRTHPLTITDNLDTLGDDYRTWKKFFPLNGPQLRTLMEKMDKSKTGFDVYLSAFLGHASEDLIAASEEARAIEDFVIFKNKLQCEREETVGWFLMSHRNIPMDDYVQALDAMVQTKGGLALSYRTISKSGEPDSIGRTKPGTGIQAVHVLINSKFPEDADKIFNLYSISKRLPVEELPLKIRVRFVPDINRLRADSSKQTYAQELMQRQKSFLNVNLKQIGGLYQIKELDKIEPTTGKSLRDFMMDFTATDGSPLFHSVALVHEGSTSTFRAYCSLKHESEARTIAAGIVEYISFITKDVPNFNARLFFKHGAIQDAAQRMWVPGDGVNSKYDYQTAGLLSPTEFQDDEEYTQTIEFTNLEEIKETTQTMQPPPPGQQKKPPSPTQSQIEAAEYGQDTSSIGTFGLGQRSTRSGRGTRGRPRGSPGSSLTQGGISTVTDESRIEALQQQMNEMMKILLETGGGRSKSIAEDHG
jgi:hypothetical protein